MMSGGEQLDAFGYLGSYSGMLDQKPVSEADDYLDEYGSGIKEVLGEEFLKACTNQVLSMRFLTIMEKLLQFPLFSGKTLSMSWIFRWIS